VKVGDLVRKRIKGSHWCLPNGMPRDYPVMAMGIILEHHEFDLGMVRVLWNGDYKTVWGQIHGERATKAGGIFWVDSFDLEKLNESR